MPFSHLDKPSIQAYLTGLDIKPDIFHTQHITQYQLDELYSRSPIPVHEEEMEKNVVGNYKYMRSITVSSRIPLYRRVSVFLHELGHHHCAKSKCLCYHLDDDNVLLEAHAMMFEMRACLSLRLMRSHYWSLYSITRWLISSCPLNMAIARQVCDSIKLVNHLQYAVTGRDGTDTRVPLKATNPARKSSAAIQHAWWNSRSREH